jgi:hypothetical protein
MGNTGPTSNCPILPEIETVTLLPITWAATMVSASHCVGFTLPGMIDDPGSFSGRLSSPKPHRGPDPRCRMSFAIFISDTATTFNAPWASTRASWVASASNYFRAEPLARSLARQAPRTLFGAVTNWCPVIFEISAAIFTSNPIFVFKPWGIRVESGNYICKSESVRTYGANRSSALRKHA